MRCPHCGASNAQDSAFCTTCGAPLEAGVEPTASSGNTAPVPAPAQAAPPSARAARQGSSSPVARAALCLALVACVIAVAALTNGFGLLGQEKADVAATTASAASGSAPAAEKDGEGKGGKAAGAESGEDAAGGSSASASIAPAVPDDAATSSSSDSAALQGQTAGGGAPTAPAPSGNPASSPTEGERSPYAPKQAAGPFWGIWIGAYHTQAEADALAREAYDRGYDPVVCLTTDWSSLNSQPYYVVSLGQCPTQEYAENIRVAAQDAYPDAYVKYTGAYQG